MNNMCIKSRISCPAKGWMDAIVTNDIDGDNVLTYAYVNDCYKLNNFGDMQILPYYLIEMIARWVSRQYIHLLTEGDDRGHWKIDVDDILQSI